MKNLTLKSALMATCLSLCGFAAQAETVLKLASIAPSGSPWGKWVTGVATKIEEISGGELKIELLLDGQAGDEQTILRQTVKGRIDIAFVSNVPLTLLAQEMAIPSSAFLFDSVEQGSCVAHQHLADTFETIMDGAGVTPLTWMEVGHYILFSKTPVKMPSDLAGMKVRVGPSIADVALASALGVNGVPLGSAESVPAIQTGAVDAGWFPAVWGLAVGVQKMAPNITVTNHARLIGSVSISNLTWEKLSDQERQWLGIFAPAGAQLTEGILGAEKALLGQAEAAGVPVHYLNEEELAAWKEAAKGVPAAVVAEAGGQAQAVADALEAAKAACGS